MAEPIEVTRECPRCHKPTTHRVTKPSSVQCKQCGRGGVWIGKKQIEETRQAERRGGSQAATAPLPDQSAEWARERPFDRLGRRPRPDGICATCGTDTDTGSARGTFVWCTECEGFRYDDATAARRAAAIERIDTAELAARQARADAAERARIDQAPAPDLADQLDTAGQIGVIRAAIAGAIRGLHDAPTQRLGMRAANAAGRLQALDRAVSDAGRTADPHDALSALQPYLRAEIRDAEQIGGEITQALAAIDIEDAREARRLELIEQQQRQAAALAEIAPRRAITAAPGPRVTVTPVPWKPCELSHRLIRPAARQVIRMGNTQYGNPEKELAMCPQHNPDKVCQGYDYSYYAVIPLNDGS